MSRPSWRNRPPPDRPSSGARLVTRNGRSSPPCGRVSRVTPRIWAVQLLRCVARSIPTEVTRVPASGSWPVLLCWLAVALDGYDLVVLGAVIPTLGSTGAIAKTALVAAEADAIARRAPKPHAEEADKVGGGKRQSGHH